jgi:hypothetical protein
MYGDLAFAPNLNLCFSLINCSLLTTTTAAGSLEKHINWFEQIWSHHSPYKTVLQMMYYCHTLQLRSGVLPSQVSLTVHGKLWAPGKHSCDDTSEMTTQCYKWRNVSYKFEKVYCIFYLGILKFRLGISQFWTSIWKCWNDEVVSRNLDIVLILFLKWGQNGLLKDLNEPSHP